MTVTRIDKDPDALTMTVTADFDASVERVWQMWADPRLLERWWGPPTYPATVVEHDLVPGGSVTYFMTGPDGDQPRGWWQVRDVRPPVFLEFEDGFAHDDGTPNPDMPTTVGRVTLAEQSDGTTRMTIVSQFASLEDLEELLAMGMEEGITAAVDQIDALLAG